MKSRKWAARDRAAQDKICRLWEERGAEYARQQQKFEEREEVRQKKARERREMEAAQVSLRSRRSLPPPIAALEVVFLVRLP